jgi:lysine 2,3-aminomutase
MPNYIISMAPGKIVLRNYEGVITTYYEPLHYESLVNVRTKLKRRISGLSCWNQQCD